MPDFKRNLRLPQEPRQTFFLWGPRQAGKTSLLKARYPDALRIDLLKTELELRYRLEPFRLREEIALHGPGRLIIIDEIQKVPALLDEVHLAIQDHGRCFALCGSSARKVRHGHANLLGGRALRFELYGLVADEIGDECDLLRLINHGYLPSHYIAEQPAPMLRAYTQDYLKEEVLAEGLVRNLPKFSDFLRSAALADTEMVSLATIARDCGVAATTVRDHYSILVDTLLGDFLPAYTRRPKRRVIQAPKFYFHDVGSVNMLAQRGRIQQGSELFGKAFENWVHHELYCYARYSEHYFDLSYWRLASGIEVDFILGHGQIAIEAKGKSRLSSDDLKGLKNFATDHPDVQRLIVVCCEPAKRLIDNKILVLPWQDFARSLWAGEIYANG